MVALATAERPGWVQAIVNVTGPNAELAAACVPVGVREPPAIATPLISGRHVAARALTEVQPDIVHAHLPLAIVVLATLRRRGERVRLATHHHGNHFVVSGRRGATWLDRASSRRLDLIVTPSDTVRRFLIEAYGYPERFVRTITNGWAGELPAGAPSGIRPTVVSVANFRPQKNHDLLLRAFARARRRVPDARLLLVGGGPGEGDVRRRAQGLGLGEAVDFTGYVEDVWPCLACSHVFALSSSYEPLGVAVLEGMAAGLPVVATAVGGIPELVQSGTNGILVESGDAVAFGDALADVLCSAALTRSMGEAGRLTAAEHTAARMVDRYFDLYSELLGRTGD